jgi:hypothetical protein
MKAYGEWIYSASAALTPHRDPVDRRLGRPQNRSGRHEEKSCPYPDSNPDPSAVASRYTDGTKNIYIIYKHISFLLDSTSIVDAQNYLTVNMSYSMSLKYPQIISAGHDAMQRKEHTTPTLKIQGFTQRHIVEECSPVLPNYAVRTSNLTLR